MAQKNGRRQPPQDPQPPLPHTLRESAQQIWMAGLSAFAKAQAGGNKVFETLIKEGEALQSRTRQAARDQVDDMATKASGTWDKLEQVFEARVANALHSLGVPTHDDIETLSRRVAELSSLVTALQAAGQVTAKTPVKTAPVRTRPVKKAPVKKTPAAKAPVKQVAAKKTPAKKASARKTAARQTRSTKAEG